MHPYDQIRSTSCTRCTLSIRLDLYRVYDTTSTFRLDLNHDNSKCLPCCDTYYYLDHMSLLNLPKQSNTYYLGRVWRDNLGPAYQRMGEYNSIRLSNQLTQLDRVQLQAFFQRLERQDINHIYINFWAYQPKLTQVLI